MRVCKTEIRRSELSTIAVNVLPWEIPILENMHGVENVTVHGETDEARVVDGPEAEFIRLERAYGVESETGKSFVSETYGNGGIGIAKLRQFMDEQMDGDKLAK